MRALRFSAPRTNLRTISRFPPASDQIYPQPATTGRPSSARLTDGYALLHFFFYIGSAFNNFLEAYRRIATAL